MIHFHDLHCIVILFWFLYSLQVLHSWWGPCSCWWWEWRSCGGWQRRSTRRWPGSRRSQRRILQLLLEHSVDISDDIGECSKIGVEAEWFTSLVTFHSTAHSKAVKWDIGLHHCQLGSLDFVNICQMLWRSSNIKLLLHKLVCLMSVFMNIFV